MRLARRRGGAVQVAQCRPPVQCELDSRTGGGLPPRCRRNSDGPWASQLGGGRPPHCRRAVPPDSLAPVAYRHAKPGDTWRRNVPVRPCAAYVSWTVALFRASSRCRQEPPCRVSRGAAPRDPGVPFRAAGHPQCVRCGAPTARTTPNLSGCEASAGMPCLWTSRGIAGRRQARVEYPNLAALRRLSLE